MKQYEIKLTSGERVRFIAEVEKQMTFNGWKKKDLALALKCPEKTVYTFFSNSKVQNRFLAAEIAHLLEIKSEDYK